MIDLPKPKAYHSHPEYLALLQTVCQYPHDLAPRLIISDRIEEFGDDARAAFIRKGCAENYPHVMARTPELAVLGDVSMLPERAAVMARRGFISWIQIDFRDFAKAAADLFKHHPVTSVDLLPRPIPAATARHEESYSPSLVIMDGRPVTVSDAGRYVSTRGWSVVEFVYKELGADLFGNPRGNMWDTFSDAASALAKAAVAYGRQKAGLGPIPADSGASGPARAHASRT